VAVHGFALYSGCECTAVLQTCLIWGGALRNKEGEKERKEELQKKLGIGWAPGIKRECEKKPKVKGK